MDKENYLNENLPEALSALSEAVSNALHERSRQMMGNIVNYKELMLAWFERTPTTSFRLTLHVGTDDPLYCDAEVLHRGLDDETGIPKRTIILIQCISRL